MSSKLKVEELRVQLSARGLDATGNKPILVRRLDEAIQKEEQEKENVSADGGRKRQRESSVGEHEKDNADEGLQGMTVRELRDLAALHGLSAKGSKRELLERVSIGMEKESKEILEAEHVEEAKKEKLVKVTKKGGAVLDQWLSETMKSRFHVLQQGEEIYVAILNQTNIGDNNNKFYVIQALESDDGGTFMVYNRWGRVGVKGQNKLHGPYTSREEAIIEFQMKFFDKTKNHWSDRKEFKFYPKSYSWLEMDYGEVEEATALNKDSLSANSEVRGTKLDSRVANFISLVCSINMMKLQMMEIGYNAQKLPLGKLSKSTILKGYDVLRRISEVIVQSDRKKLEELTGEFYTVIPHDYGFKKMRDFVIDTPYKLKSKLEMVEALGEIEIAATILKEDPAMQVEKYMLNTHAETHSDYTVDIVQIFKVSRLGEADRFKKFSSIKNRMLLWHGSRLTNWMGILSQGLRIAPPEAPSTGYMFGKGVYFADMFSKSANYCYASKGAGVLLLCEVALGDMNELLAADYNANQLPKGKLSTKGVGATAPDTSESCHLEDVVIPLGKPKEQAGPKGCLLYNEYIVYNVEQVRMRYVVQVNFNPRRRKV